MEEEKQTSEEQEPIQKKKKKFSWERFWIWTIIIIILGILTEMAITNTIYFRKKANLSTTQHALSRNTGDYDRAQVICLGRHRPNQYVLLPVTGCADHQHLCSKEDSALSTHRISISICSVTSLAVPTGKPPLPRDITAGGNVISVRVDISANVPQKRTV